MTPLCDLLSVAQLGWFSGFIVMASAVPNLYRNFREAGSGKPSLARDAIQCLGNCCWVHYGMLQDDMPIAAMCAMSAFFMGVLISQQIWKHANTRASESS